jgi:hypothetical protein
MDLRTCEASYLWVCPLLCSDLHVVAHAFHQNSMQPEMSPWAILLSILLARAWGLLCKLGCWTWVWESIPIHFPHPCLREVHSNNHERA